MIAVSVYEDTSAANGHRAKPLLLALECELVKSVGSFSSFELVRPLCTGAPVVILSH
jgi:hypothetical protein